MRHVYGNVDLSRFSCPNKDCKNFGRRGASFVRVKSYYGPRKTAFIVCRICNKGYSETRDTPFFHLRVSDEKLVAILTSLTRGGGVRSTAAVVGVDQNTVMRIGEVAGAHAKKLHDHLVTNLKVDQIQADEIYTFVAKKGSRRNPKRKA